MRGKTRPAAIMAALPLAGFSRTGVSKPPPCKQLSLREDAPIVELVVRRELTETDLTRAKDIYLEVDGGGSGKAIMRYPTSRGLRLYSAPWSCRCRHWQHLTIVSVSLGAHRDAASTEVQAETLDETLREVDFGVHRDGTQGILTPVLQDEGDCLAEVLQTLRARFALAIRPRHLGAVCNLPGTVHLDNRGEFVAHAHIA